MMTLAAVALLLAQMVAPHEPVDAVSEVLVKGAAAEATGDGKKLLAAAEALDALGARPAVAGPGLSEHWRGLARRRGVTARTPPLRGRALGPAYRTGVLAPGTEVSTEQVFLAGHKAVVVLVPQAAGALDLRIVGDDRTDVCARTAQPPRATCSWLPVFTTRVDIRVANRSANPARYYLVSN